MAKTAVADIIIPTEFERYTIERTAELSAFGQCGIVEHAPEFDDLAAGGGKTVEMPFWKDLNATRQDRRTPVADKGNSRPEYHQRKSAIGETA